MQTNLLNVDSRLLFRKAESRDLKKLTDLETRAFEYDRLSSRRFRHWIGAENCIFQVILHEEELIGYGLVLLLKGTRLARLYSIAIDETWRRKGLATAMLMRLEESAAQVHRLFMRLEVALENTPALSFYKKMGYTIFDSLSDYYEGHQDAFRMQKRIRYISENYIRHSTPWYQQTTAFTCGPASLLMAMASLDKQTPISQEAELDIWREATTIFMTSGHGGCHPVGLALAARKRGFACEVYVNTDRPLFIEGVRDSHKKSVMAVVDKQFRSQAKHKSIPVYTKDVSQEELSRWIEQGVAVVILISTYRMDGKKAPHWVCVSAVDDSCLYVHDPDPEEGSPLDCQYLPIARDDFAKMSAFGKDKLRACVILSR